MTSASHDSGKQRALETGRVQSSALDHEDVGTRRLANEPGWSHAQNVVHPASGRLGLSDPIVPVVEGLVPREDVIVAHLNRLIDDRARFTYLRRQRSGGHPENGYRGRCDRRAAGHGQTKANILTWREGRSIGCDQIEDGACVRQVVGFERQTQSAGRALDPFDVAGQ